MNHRIYNAVYRQPWNIEPGAWEGIHVALSQRKEMPVSEGISDLFLTRNEYKMDQNGIAHIDVQGILGELSPMEKECGGTDYGDLVSEFKQAQSEARGLMMTIGSPGGQAIKSIETAEAFADFDGPSAVFIDSMGASAGYALAAPADQIVASPSAIVGSIGTILAYVDKSKQWEAAGLKADYITSGKLKTSGMPPSNTPEERAAEQEIVDDLGAQFRAHVTRFRDIAPETMEGQAFVGARAESLNLIDQTGTFEDAYYHILSNLR